MKPVTRRQFLAASAMTSAASIFPAMAGSQSAKPALPSQAASALRRSPTAPNDGTKFQAKPPKPYPFGAEAFRSSKTTTVRWLGNGGLFLNSRGTTAMLDPLMEGYDLPFLYPLPIMPQQVPRLDGVIITHVDNDHYSLQTCHDLAAVCKNFHSTLYVAEVMKKDGLVSFGHDIGDSFDIGPMHFTLTPADHSYQKGMPAQPGQHKFEDKDCCGYRIETPDGTIWAPGDTRFMEAHLHQPTPDVLFMDFADNSWHYTLAGAAKVANAYPNSIILPSHWGTIDSPDFTPFNGDPEKFRALLINPDRLHILAPGEPYEIKRLKKA